MFRRPAQVSEIPWMALTRRKSESSKPPAPTRSVEVVFPTKARRGLMDGSVPMLLAHADWGVSPIKRWRAVARLGGDGRYTVDGPDLVGSTGTVTERMGIPELTEGTSLLGFDFPIGVPRKYAEIAGIREVRPALLEFGHGPWNRFFDVADAREDISIHRPFYPLTSGIRGQHTRQALLDALGLEKDELLRRCEAAHGRRRAANPLFWTLGGAQVGKGALTGWREMLIPALRDEGSEVALWPFDGELRHLLTTRKVVIAETYPAEFYAPLGIRFGTRDSRAKSGKRQQHDRRAQASALLGSSPAERIVISDRLKAEVLAGFGPHADGEDRFDAVVGLLGMIQVVFGRLPEGPPCNDPAVRLVEGWILGRPAA
jgi:hypothetical protein